MRHKGKKFTWNNAAEESFQRIKKKLCEAPVLGMPTENGMYVLDTDASVVAISGILHQEQEQTGISIYRKWWGRTTARNTRRQESVPS